MATDNVINFRQAWIRRQWKLIRDSTEWSTREKVAALIFIEIDDDTKMGCPFCGAKHSNKEGCEHG